MLARLSTTNFRCTGNSSSIHKKVSTICQMSIMLTQTGLLQHMEGMSSWCVSDKPKPEPPHLLDRTKTIRTGEPEEKSKNTRVSKHGTVIRLGLCK